jgi:hypothetical protein
MGVLNYPERRRMARLPLQVLLRFKLPGRDELTYAETRNVSAGGIYFAIAPIELVAGQELECVMVLPETITHLSSPVLIGCRGKILRIQRDHPHPFLGVAMEISSYDFSFEHEPNADHIKAMQGLFGNAKAADTSH